jgi:NitT/TauT family transport system ATP-binding protein
MIRFTHVTKRFTSRRTDTLAIDDVTLSIDTGEFVSFVGPSGCGKSTLLNLAAGLLSPDSGVIEFDGAPLSGPNDRVGYLTQEDALLPWRSVLSNVALPLEVRRLPRAERHSAAREALLKVGLHKFEHHLPHQLSGGMRKRVALARTLVYRPRTLLLDEPFGALDAQTRLTMQNELRTIAREAGLTVVLVTHDLNEAIALSDRIVAFSRRPARVLDTFRPPRAAETLNRVQPLVGSELYQRLWNLLDETAQPGENA